MESQLTNMSTIQPQAGARLHTGVIVSVIFVTLSAIVAAVFIIKKYCFPRSEATYRYSVLKGMEDQGLAITDDDDKDMAPCTVSEESDEELLE